MSGDTEAWIMKELRQPLDLDAFAAAALIIAPAAGAAVGAPL